MPYDEALSRSFYTALGAEGLRRRTLAEMWRVLDVDGLAVIEGPLPPAPGAELPADRINRSLVQGLPNPHYIHDPSTLSSRCTEAGIGQAEIFIRDWAGRERMILLFRRLPADTGRQD